MTWSLRTVVCLVVTMAALARGPAAHGRTGDDCPPAADGLTLWLSPEAPTTGQAVHVMATAASPLPAGAELRLDGRPLPVEAASDTGARWRSARLATLPSGRHRIELQDGERTLACTTVSGARKSAVPAAPKTHWPTRHAWTPAHEAYYQAWLERLFMAPPDVDLTFRPLGEALKDPQRNGLFNHLGLGEDGPGRGALEAAPDCADLPYFLRAYFSWKLGLPFAFRACDRGTADRPPRCPALHHNEEPTRATSPLGAFKGFVRFMVNKVHSGALRTALDDDATDFYPVPLTREALAPGTIFADPYGHVLVLARWLDRPARPGRLFAVDGQPDASVSRKRFWEGNFIFASDVPSAGAGWKAFRPLRRATPNEAPAAWVQARNAEIAEGPLRFDRAQAGMSPEAFYARMFQLITPQGSDAATVFDETLDALIEQIEARVRSVQNGEDHLRHTQGAVIEMPEGAQIFETVGPWEDYATPSRDMRLLIAMNVLAQLPERLTTHPELFALGAQTPGEARKALEERQRTRTAARTITYLNSAGSPVALSVAQILARRRAFEMAYNPNDCVELRWGAEPGSAEMSTCKRRAPAAQTERMHQVRRWFAEARRPPRT
ncbi:MAG: hypothetical protein KA712_06720 [Myxococcales bacterium]|nr:hypothetical protein [Myxococcales bacterium]